MARFTLMCLAVLAGSLCAEARRDLQSDDCGGACVEQYEKCAGKGFASPVSCCNPTHSCVKKNEFYSQCVNAARAAINIATQGWDGEIMTCAGGSYGENLGGSYGEEQGSGYGSTMGTMIRENDNDSDGRIEEDFAEMDETDMIERVVEDADASMTSEEDMSGDVRQPSIGEAGVSTESDVNDGNTGGADGDSQPANRNQATDPEDASNEVKSSGANIGLIVGLVGAAVVAAVIVGGAIRYKSAAGASALSASAPSATTTASL